jgi:predicted HTH domain antitoxin
MNEREEVGNRYNEREEKERIESLLINLFLEKYLGIRKL